MSNSPLNLKLNDLIVNIEFLQVGRFFSKIHQEWIVLGLTLLFSVSILFLFVCANYKKNKNYRDDPVFGYPKETIRAVYKLTRQDPERYFLTRCIIHQIKTNCAIKGLQNNPPWHYNKFPNNFPGHLTEENQRLLLTILAVCPHTCHRYDFSEGLIWNKIPVVETSCSQPELAYANGHMLMAVVQYDSAKRLP